jgi:tetratricopeptide (TPR) repeat protein
MHLDSDFKFASIGQGIDCERCHGPGELHVKQRSKGQGVDVKKEIDPTIVNPRKLSWERQIDLCQRCHLQGLNVLKNEKKFTDFKPGMKLSDIFEIYLPEYEGYTHSFDMANHAQRFQMSQCFIQGNKDNLDFTCISCHNPHVSVKMTGKEVYNTACKNCHQTKGCKEIPSVLANAKNNCVSCHMPSSSSEDIPHVSVHDHYIRVPEAKKDIKQMQKIVGLYAVNNPAPNIETEILAYLEYWEKFDKNPFYITKAHELLKQNNYPKLWLKYHYLTENYKAAIALSLEADQLSAWQNYMLGIAYLKENKQSLGIFHLEKSYKKEPTNMLIASELFKWYAQKSNIYKTINFGEQLLKEYPTNGIIYNNLAKAYIMDGKTAKALPYMNKALQYEPDNLLVWTTFLNYYASIRDRTKFMFWLTKINDRDSSYLNKDQIQSLLDRMS